MTVFTVFGLAIFIFFVLVVISILLNIAYGDHENQLGFITVLVFISIFVALFIVKPQEYGYEKIIVSENSIEKAR